MAIYKGTALVSQVIGKLGENIFQRWKNKLVVKDAEISVSNPNSARQIAIRDALEWSTKAFNTTLTDAQREQWEVYCRACRGFKKKPEGIRQIIDGNDGKYTGLDSLVRTNILLVSAGLTKVSAPPLSETPPQQPLTLSATWDPDAYILTVAWTNPTLPTGTKIRIWIDCVSFLNSSAPGVKPFHKQIAAKPLATDLSVNLTELNSYDGDPLLFYTVAAGDWWNVIVQADYITPKGNNSASSETVDEYMNFQAPT